MVILTGFLAPFGITELNAPSPAASLITKGTSYSATWAAGDLKMPQIR